MSNVRRSFDPDPVGITVLLLIGVGALLAFLFAGCNGAPAYNFGEEAAALVVALIGLRFAWFLLRTIARAIRWWKQVHDQYKTQHHESPHH